MGACIPDIETMLQAGIDPATHKPTRAGNRDKNKPFLKEKILMELRVLDEQNAVNRYNWYNLPDGLDSQLVERMLYYRGQLAFFYVKDLDRFFLLPYALNGSIDVYGRYNAITPLPFGGGKAESEKDTKPDSRSLWLSTIKRIPVKDGQIEITTDIFDNGCVILHDYTKQRSEEITPRSVMQESLLDTMSEIIPLARTAMISNCGVEGLRVDDADQQLDADITAEDMLECALTGKPFMPLIAKMEFQELGTKSSGVYKVQEFLQAFQAFDNLRLSFYGLKNGGVFEKDNAYVNNTTASAIQGNVGVVYDDGLKQRQRFCDLVNLIWDLGIWVEAPETVQNADVNMDGEIATNQDQSGVPNEQPAQGGEE